MTAAVDLEARFNELMRREVEDPQAYHDANRELYAFAKDALAQIEGYEATERNLRADLARANQQNEAIRAVVEGVRELIADDHMFPTTDDAAWGVVTHHWDKVIAALAALDRPQPQEGG